MGEMGGPIHTVFIVRSMMVSDHGSDPVSELAAGEACGHACGEVDTAQRSFINKFSTGSHDLLNLVRTGSTAVLVYIL